MKFWMKLATLYTLANHNVFDGADCNHAALKGGCSTTMTDKYYFQTTQLTPPMLRVPSLLLSVTSEGLIQTITLN